MTDDTDDDAKNWVTIKIPEQTRNRARDIDAATYGEVMNVGIKSLSEEPAAQLTAEITPQLDEGRVDNLVDELQGRLGEADPIDREALARTVAQKIDYVQVAEQVSERIVNELEGRR